MVEHSFQEVIHQFDRMCKAHPGCINCRLHQNYSNDECDIGTFIRHPKEIEQTVMQWAAEHPEPVYPTWEMYLIERMTADMRDGKTQNPQSVEAYMCRTRIPAEIAQKLGIEPKEK